jgi:hypothetical protein
MGAESALVMSLEQYDGESSGGHGVLEPTPEVEKEHAATAIVDLAMRHQGDL